MFYLKKAFRLAVLLSAMGSACFPEAPPADSIEGWRDMRFGMFIHWGPVSLKGTEIGWSRGREVPIEEYDQLYESFHPAGFNAAEWVSLAKDAGMKYLVITAKHHDGFCLWDSQYTDYDIMATRYRHDILKELSEECRRQGISFSTYYSICDWYHPDYPTGSPGGKTAKPSPNMARYFQYVKAQTAEILDRYGPLNTFWFDGEWEEPWTVEHGNELYQHLKTLQPDLIINNRVNKGRRGMEGTTREGLQYPGDYDTPEQEVGAFSRVRPWETSMTLCRQWAWKPDDELKSLKECLWTLVQTVGGDGNLLLNVGPMPGGRIEPRQARRLREIGNWMKTYGEAVYGTRGGPFLPGPWGASTCRADRIYLLVTSWPEKGPLLLPGLDRSVQYLRTLSGKVATVEQDNGRISVSVPRNNRSEPVTVIELQVKGKALEIPVTAVPPHGDPAGQ